MKYDGKKFLSDLKFYNDYSKWNKELKRYETWEESATDVISMHRKKDDIKSTSELNLLVDEAEQLYRDKVVLASQRNLQFRGDQVNSKNERIYNCFDINTEFITSNGVKTFSDFSENDNCNVITHKGLWKNAIVKQYGIQKLYELTFSKSGIDKKIVATKDHRWLLKDNNITTTIDIGDKITKIPNTFQQFDWEKSTVDEKLYWCYGMVYGDGTITLNNNKKYSLIRLCNNDIKYEYRFKEMGFKTSSSLSLNGDIIAYTGKYDKLSPNPTIDSPELIRAFVHGYLCADGTKSRNKNGKLYTHIQSSDKDHIDFIRTCFPIAGVYIMSEYDLTGEKTNYGIRPYTIKFSLSEGTNGHTDSYWKLTNIVYLKTDYVWCLEVDDDKSFTMPNGIVTGNCVTCYLDNIDKIHKAFYLSLCGCGITASLHSHWTSKLPNIIKRSEKVKNHIIDDSIEGWADAAGILISSFCDGNVSFPEYQGYIVRFDYSEIRLKGSKISGGFKAPGPDGLKQSMELMELLLNKAEVGKQLKTIDAYDLLMHCADATLSGGVRRAAMAVMIDSNDHEMLNAKTGNWRLENKQRERSNNSVILIRGSFTEEYLHDLISINGGMSDLGFAFVENYYIVFNPCFEVGMTPILDYETEETGFQFCNLSEVNALACVKNGKLNKQLLFSACKAASTIGTLQAGYTSFPYLGETSEKITEREALIGVSITGWMDNPELFNEEILKEAVDIINLTNKIVANIIGINIAARTTVVKPSGNASVILGTASGIHPEHSERYFRIMQINKDSEIGKWLGENAFYDMLEDSVWSATQSDYVIYVPIENKSHCLFKEDIKGIEHLEKIKLVQNSWIKYGKREELCFNKDVMNNVSCTVIVDDYAEISKYVFDNQENFTAISFLSDYGDKDYPQSPFTSVLNSEELLKKYGDGVIFASGLIVDGLHYFDNNLWDACEHIIDKDKKIEGSRTSILLKKDWIRRAKQFAKNNFKGNLQETVYCLKDVHLWHKFVKIKRNLKVINFEEILIEPRYNDVSNYTAAACSGGSCEIRQI